MDGLGDGVVVQRSLSLVTPNTALPVASEGQRVIYGSWGVHKDRPSLHASAVESVSGGR